MSERPRVLVLATPEDGGAIESQLAAIDCDTQTATELFDAISALDSFEPDAVIIDLRMEGDVGFGFGHWVRDHDAEIPMIGLVDVGMTPDDLGAAPDCDELCLNPPQEIELRRLIARARGEDVEALAGPPEPKLEQPANQGLTVKVSADLFEASDTASPPQGGLLVGTGKDAQHPDFHEVAEDYAHYDDWFGDGASDQPAGDEPPAPVEAEAAPEPDEVGDTDDTEDTSSDDAPDAADERPRTVVHEENLIDRSELLNQLRQLSM